jgi:hypothetical protein
MEIMFSIQSNLPNEAHVIEKNELDLNHLATLEYCGFEIVTILNNLYIVV